MSQKVLQAAKKWLEAAVANPKSSASFGKNIWEKMHGGGTSKYPHCRPMGLYNPRDATYNVKLFYVPDKDKSAEVLVETFTIQSATGGEPTKKEVYSALIAKVNEKLSW